MRCGLIFVQHLSKISLAPQIEIECFDHAIFNLELTVQIDFLVFLFHFGFIAGTTSERLIWHDFSLALFLPEYELHSLVETVSPLSKY